MGIINKKGARKVEINIQAVIGICSEFMSLEKGQKGEVSIVISPLKVAANEEGLKISVIMGCNMWQSCHNGGCWYSIEARKTKA